MKPIQKIIDVQKVASEILVHNMMECNFANTKDLLRSANTDGQCISYDSI